MEFFSLIGNSQRLDSGAMVVRPPPGPRPSLRSGPLAASGFVPDEPVATQE